MKLKHQYEQFADIYKHYIFNPDDEVFYTDDPENFKKPEGYEDWKVEQFDVNDYGLKRLQELGFTDKLNTIELIGTPNEKAKKNERIQERIFSINKRGGIEILQYTLRRKPLIAEVNDKGKERYVFQTRLHPWEEHICEGKYDFTNARNAPFWSPELIEMFEEQEDCPTLVITEGQFKARKACIEGIPTVGLTSISHFKSNGTLHAEIIEFIKVCKVKTVIVLWDGDCRNISLKDLERMEPIDKRPKYFLHYARSIKEQIKLFSKKTDVFFSTINTYSLHGEPKGIDDLFLIHQDKKEDILRDFENVGNFPGTFISWLPMNSEEDIKGLRKFFKLQWVNDFYQFHQDKIRDKSFIWSGNTYKIEKGKPVMEISADIKRYKRIGINYYKIINTPVPSGWKGETVTEEVLEPWSKTAILEDHPKHVIDQIERYEGFTNVASHTDYQPVINNHWNLYSNINHKVEEGEWPHIQLLLKHLFEEHYENEMILDYITILFRYPMQKLPVICLVSKDQETGKSTFLYLMKLIFKQNMAIISNNDLTSDFNSHWTSKLIVASEETLLEKKDGYEKIKSLSTAKEIMRNEKNKTAKTIPCMIHFIFCSNHEDDFIKINDHDSRLWIRKVKPLTESIADFDYKLEQEIPAFLHYITNREIKYKTAGKRLFFTPKDFQTDAFRNVVKNSEPGVIKELRIKLEDYFVRHRVPELKMTADDLRQVFGIRGENNYLNKVIKDFLRVERFKNGQGNEAVTTYWFFTDNPNDVDQPFVNNRKGRPFVFNASDFLSIEEIEEPETIEPSEEPDPEVKQETIPF